RLLAVQALAELPLRLTQRAGEVRDLLAAEQEQDDDEDDDQLRRTDVHGRLLSPPPDRGRMTTTSFYRREGHDARHPRPGPQPSAPPLPFVPPALAAAWHASP